MNVRLIALFVPPLLAACAITPPMTDPVATATIRNAAGQAIGTASLTPDSGGLRINAAASGLAVGQHGIHLHAVGRCDTSDFATAGPHLNPAARQHGLQNPQGSHVGDLPNLVVASDGRGALSWRWQASAADVFDNDGTAIVVHAAADDQRTDPSGNSGGRVACGVLMRP